MNNFIDSVKFQYYPNSVYQTTPLGFCSLRDMLNAIKEPKENILEIFKQIEIASKEGDLVLKAKLKSQLYYFNPCCVMDGEGRKYENIVDFTEIMLVDIDNLEEGIAKDLKQYLFENNSFVVASFLSVSKKGVKLIVRIPKALSTEDFKSYFYGLMSSWQFIKGIDLATQNCVLPSFLTYDRDILINENPTVFNKRGVKVDEFKKYDGSEEFEKVDATEEDRNKILKLLTNTYNTITDSGHFINRGISTTAWGFVAAGYFTEEEMEDILFDFIDGNSYLSLKSNSYKKTTLDMKKIGLSSPLTLKDE